MAAEQTGQHSLPLWGNSSGPAEHRPLFAVGERVGYIRDASWRGRVVQVAADPDSGRHHFWVVWAVGRPGGPFEYTAAGNTFTVTAPAPAGEQPHAANSFRYEVTIRGK